MDDTTVTVTFGTERWSAHVQYIAGPDAIFDSPTLIGLVGLIEARDPNQVSAVFITRNDQW